MKRARNWQPENSALNLKVKFLRELALSLLEELRGLDERPRVRVERGINLYDEVSRFEIELIRCALHHTGGHQVKAARLLGLKTTTLNNKIKQYKIPISKADDAGHALRGTTAAGKSKARRGAHKLSDAAPTPPVRKEDAVLIG